MQARLTLRTAKRLNWSLMELREHTRKQYPELLKLKKNPVREIQRGKHVIVVCERSRPVRSNPFQRLSGRVTETYYVAKHPVTGEWDEGVTIKQLMCGWPTQAEPV